MLLEERIPWQGLWLLAFVRKSTLGGLLAIEFNGPLPSLLLCSASGTQMEGQPLRCSIDAVLTALVFSRDWEFKSTASWWIAGRGWLLMLAMRAKLELCCNAKNEIAYYWQLKPLLNISMDTRESNSSAMRSCEQVCKELPLYCIVRAARPHSRFRTARSFITFAQQGDICYCRMHMSSFQELSWKDGTCFVCACVRSTKAGLVSIGCLGQHAAEALPESLLPSGLEKLNFEGPLRRSRSCEAPMGSLFSARMENS